MAGSDEARLQGEGSHVRLQGMVSALGALIGGQGAVGVNLAFEPAKEGGGPGLRRRPALGV